MSEFNNRIAAQREVLSTVNRINWSEELFGLSSGAIDRWISKNKIEANVNLVSLINLVASKLFFLSNKSQEQITEDYQKLSSDVSDITRQIREEIYRNYQARIRHEA
ncbi:hypothetical protein [Endozoicomonas sp. ALC020]|uniref:hypothetical protein n=1 Tax=unclassified Endozoicomonas TaxID=2644528 RepID=UPI003BB1E70D